MSQKRNLVQYHSVIISALVVGVLWVIANEIPTALREKSFPVPVLTSEVKSLLVLRSQDKLQSPMGQLTTHKIMTGKNTGGRLPLLRWEAEEKWVGGRLCIGFSCRWWIFRIGNICGWRLLVFYVLSLSKLRDFWVVKTCKYANHSPCRQCWV